MMTMTRTTRLLGLRRSGTMVLAAAALMLTGWFPKQCFLPEVIHNPPAPKPEPVEISSLPLPPSAPTDPDGSVIPEGCTHPTGCMDPSREGVQSGRMMWDNEHYLMLVEYAGAPEGSIFDGLQVVALKTTLGATFSNGEAWKCLTCGVPPENDNRSGGFSYPPTAVHDGTRLVTGTNVVSCGEQVLTDDACTPAEVQIYGIRSPTRAGAPFFFGPRETRLSPDDTTLGFSQFSANFVPGPDGTEIVFGQFCYVGQLEFNATPGDGGAPRYDLVDVYRLFDGAPEAQPWRVDPRNPGKVLFNPLTRTCGELRGFSADGKEAYGIHFPAWSNHIDLFATDLETGKTRRITRTEYIDPGRPSPDDKWFLGLDVHVSRRNHFLGAMDGLPAINDMITTGLVSEIRNNRNRRFFQPMLTDRYGQRGDYQGQQINGGFDDGPGGISDPNWNARADPAWSPDGTKIVYAQTLVSPPACGGDNPPCPESTEPGGRRSRLMIAHLTSRHPKRIQGAPPVRPVGSWAQPFAENPATPLRPILPEGTYTLDGKIRGTVSIEVTHKANGVEIESVSAVYDHFKNDCRVFDGFERVEEGEQLSQFTSETNWDSDITMRGCETGTKITRDENGNQGQMTMSAADNNFQATGTLTTTIDGEVFTQPPNGQ